MHIDSGDLGSAVGGGPFGKSTSHAAGRRRAAGIYGTIVTAAMLAAGANLATAALAVAVLVTLLVYWTAEQYAELLAEQAEHGHLPSWSRIGSGFASTWPMVSAAYIPVLALIVSRLFGASKAAAANIGLIAAVVMLLIHGWVAARAAELRGPQLILTTLIAGFLGAVMVVLKNFVVTNLH